MSEGLSKNAFVLLYSPSPGLRCIDSQLNRQFTRTPMLIPWLLECLVATFLIAEL